MRQPLYLMKDHSSRATAPCPTLKAPFPVCLFLQSLSLCSPSIIMNALLRGVVASSASPPGADMAEYLLKRAHFN